MFQYLKWAYKKSVNCIFSRAYRDRGWESDFKVKECGVRFGIGKKFFSLSMVRHSNRFPRVVLGVPPLEVSMVRLDRSLITFAS